MRVRARGGGREAIASGPDCRGFTLLELLVALLLVGLVGGWLVRFTGAQQRGYARQRAVVAATQNAGAAVDLWAAEARNAGFDPRSTAAAGLTHTTVDSVGWTADLNTDGDVDDFGPGGDERVLYYYDARARELVRRADGRPAAVVDGVDTLAFRYLDRRGQPTIDPDRVASVQLLLRFSALDGELRTTLPAIVRLRNVSP